MGMMSPWLRDSSDSLYQRLLAMTVSQFDSERLGRPARLKRLTAASDLNNEPRAKTEASTAKPRMSSATAISVLGDERHDSIKDAIAETVQSALSLWESVEGTQLNYNVTFAVAWDPIAFIKDQCYDFGPQEAIARAITLIGTATEAQAIRSAQYIDEM